MVINILNMLFKLLTIYIVLCLPSSGMGQNNHGKNTAGHKIHKKESFGLNKSRDSTLEESSGFKVQELKEIHDIKQESKLQYHNEHEKKSINKYRRSIPVRSPRSRIHDNDKRYNATSRTGLAHLAKAVISDIKKLEDKYQVSVSGVAKIHQRMMNNFGNYTWRHASLPGGGYINQQDISPSKPKGGKQHKSFKPNSPHDKRGKVHKKEKIVDTTNPPLTYKPSTYKPSTYKPSTYKPSTYKPLKTRTTEYPRIQVELSTTEQSVSFDDEDAKFGSYELTDTTTSNIIEEISTIKSVEDTSELKHPAKKYIFNNDEFDSKDTYQPSQFRLKPYHYYHHFHHDFKPQHDHHFSHSSETSTHKIYPSSYSTTESYDQRTVLTEKSHNIESKDATPIVEFEPNESDETSAEKTIGNDPNFDDIDEPPSDITMSVPSPTSTGKKSDGIPVIELFVSNQSQIVSPKNQNHTDYYVVYEPPEGIAMHDSSPTSSSYTSVQESDAVPDTIPQILNIEMIRPESNTDYSESAIFFPEENQNYEIDPCQNRGLIQISLNLGLPCSDVSEIDDNPEDLYKREFALNMTDVFNDYLEKEKERRKVKTPLDIDVRAGRRRRASDKEKKKDKKPTPNNKKVHNKKDLKNGSVFGEILDVPKDLSNNNSNEYFNLSMLSDYFLEAVDSLDEASLIEVLVALKDDFLSKSPSDQTVVDEVYNKLVASLLEYKRAKHNLVERKRRESPKKGRSEAASFLELLAETDRFIESEQKDDPSVNDYYSDNNDPDDGLESNENPSFLELVSLADKHKSRV